MPFTRLLLGIRPDHCRKVHKGIRYHITEFHEESHIVHEELYTNIFVSCMGKFCNFILVYVNWGANKHHVLNGFSDSGGPPVSKHPFIFVINELHQKTSRDLWWESKTSMYTDNDLHCMAMVLLYELSFEVMTLLHLVESLARSYRVSDFSFRYLSGQLDTCLVI